MNADRISSLTDSQRAYLRLVFQHQSSKQIAQRFDISAHTVDKRIKEAMRLLDVGSRIEAARLLVEIEAEGDHPLGPQSPDLSILPFPSSASGSGSREGRGDVQQSRIRVEEDRHAFHAHPLRTALPLPFPTRERHQNDLSILQRLGWTIGLIIGLALATGILLSGLTALGTLLVTLRN